MVACVTPVAHTKSEQAGSSVAGGHVPASTNWQSYSGGFPVNIPSNRTESGIHLELPSRTLPKPERQLYREPEGEGGEYDYYLHGRKRAKLHDSVPCPVSQVSINDVV